MHSKTHTTNIYIIIMNQHFWVLNTAEVVRLSLRATSTRNLVCYAKKQPKKGGINLGLLSGND